MKTREESQVGKGSGHTEVSTGFCPRGAEKWKPGVKQKASQADGLHVLWIRFMQPPELFQAPIIKIKQGVPTILQYHILARNCS